MVGTMSQLSQSTVVFVVSWKKSFKIIVEPEKIEQNKPDKTNVLDRRGMDTSWTYTNIQYSSFC